MKYLFKILMLFFSLGILLYPAQNNIYQNLAPQNCCKNQGVCHKNLPEKNHENPSSQDCCNISMSAFQFIKLDERVSTLNVQKHNFKPKVSFYYSNSLALNTLLDGVWQPPKFI